MAKCNLAIWHQYNRKVTPKKHLICGLSLCVTFLLLYCDCILIIFKQFFLALNTTLPFLINKSTGTMQASLKKKLNEVRDIKTEYLTQTNVGLLLCV